MTLLKQGNFAPHIRYGGGSSFTKSWISCLSLFSLGGRCNKHMLLMNLILGQRLRVFFLEGFVLYSYIFFCTEKLLRAEYGF